jgi:CheY-like chemotaxis protein
LLKLDLPITASGDPAILEDAHKVGFAEVMHKPLFGRSLHDALQRHLGELLDTTFAEPGKNDQAHGGGAAEEVLRRDFQDARILLAEDEPVNREIQRQLLEDIGWQVDTAEDAASPLGEQLAY